MFCEKGDQNSLAYRKRQKEKCANRHTIKKRQKENVESHCTHAYRKGMLAERHPDRKVSNRLKGMCSKWFDTDDRYAVKKVRKVGLQEKIHIQGKSGRKTEMQAIRQF